MGCLVGYFFHINIDGIVGLLVALFILYSGINIVKETISPLLGQQADAELVEKIHALVLSHEKVLGVHDLLVHDYGPGQCFASLHAELSAAEDALACHEIIDHIENEVRKELHVDLVIHYDPVVTDDAEGNAMREMVKEIISQIDPRLSMHDFRITDGRKLVFDLAVPYDMGQQYEALQQKIDESLQEKGKDYTTEIRFDGKA